MGMSSMVVRVNPATYRAVHDGMPKDWTPSAWIREIVETLTNRPETNCRRRALQDLIEKDHKGGRLLYMREERSGPFKLRFRCQAEHWTALNSLAQAAGLSQTTYFRRAMYMGSSFQRRWYECYEKDADPITTKPERFRQFGPSRWPLYT